MKAITGFCSSFFCAVLFAQPSVQVTVAGKFQSVIQGNDPLGLNGQSLSVTANINPVGVTFNPSSITYWQLAFTITTKGMRWTCTQASATITIANPAEQGNDTLVVGNCKLSNGTDFQLTAAFAPHTLPAPIPLAFTAALLTAKHSSRATYKIRGQSTSLGISGHTQSECAKCPALTLGPATGLIFTVPFGGSRPPPQNLTVRTAGTALAYAVTATTSGGNWLSVDRPGGITGGSLSVSVDPSSLPAGTYMGTVTVYTAASNAPQIEPVDLVVTTPSFTLLTDPPEIILDSTAGVAPQPATLTVTATPAHDQRYSVSVSTTGDLPWLFVSPSTGTAGGKGLSVGADITKVPGWGTYQGSVTLAASGASNNPVRVPVTLRLMNVIHSFAGGSDGADPAAPLTIGKGSSSSVLYGVTAQGGAANAGAVFSLTPPARSNDPWSEQLLYAFRGTADGAHPLASLAIYKGVLYGVTESGGKGGGGSVFALSPPSHSGDPWTESVLHSFTNGADGGDPQGRLVIASGGLLYGTTVHGGRFGQGTVFLLSAPASPGGFWSEQVLHNFGSSGDGANPHAALLMGIGPTGQPVLYGTTDQGGTNGNGIVFSLTPRASPQGDWTETIIHSFAGGPDGATPHSGPLVMGQGGTIYGTTWGGGLHGSGTIFMLIPPATGGSWTKKVLYNCSVASGESPNGLVLSGGALYGTTSTGGGSGSGQGTVFELKPPSSDGQPWQFNLLHTFLGPEGANPQAGLVIDQQGVMFGVSSSGGPFNLGAAFELIP
jgi:uncharacterized repeat protein (TIGR03803 family)